MLKLFVKISACIAFATLLLVTVAYQTAYAVGSMLASGTDSYTYTPYRYQDGEGDLPPTGILKVRNDSGNMDQLLGTTATVFTFDGNSNYDDETSTTLLEVRYDFENDGNLDTYFSVIKTEKHSYDTPGWKTVRMDVLDRGGNVTSVTEDIYIVENTAPDAYFTVEPKIGTPGTLFRFNTTHSTDHQYNDNLLKYRFDFNGDGVFEAKFKNNRSWQHKFATSGLKKVTLEVKDPEGLSSFYSQQVLIKVNTAPIATLSAVEQRGSENISVYMLDASGSSDSDGSKLKYRWDFNHTGENDIQYNTNWYNSDKAYAYFYRSGEYVIKLLVKDEDGAIDMAFVSLIVDLMSD